MADPYGQTTPSIYETARMVSLAPWLGGHADRVRFLLAEQQPNGAWGQPDGYGVVPTLSATEALLRSPETRDAAMRGLHVLFDWNDRAIPDTIAAEVLVPQLVEDINRHLDEAGWPRRLGLPAGIDSSLLTALRARAAAGTPPPAKLWHSLEFLGPAAVAAAGVAPEHGLVCGSAAATAAWLGDGPAPANLEAMQARHGGPVPGICPITVFENAWIAAAMADAGLAHLVSPQIIDELRAACGPDGAPAAPGLPADADDTAAVLYALAKLGSPVSSECLWRYETTDYFQCFLGERSPSTSTNAHVLDALIADPTRGARHEAAIAKVARWLVALQEPDGSWWDKWHASPYYATQCCVAALARSGQPGATEAVERAGRWVLATQRADGSWGRWRGTDEETSYAVQILLHTNGSPGAVARGCEFLRREDRDGQPDPLWHDKDLYAPVNVIAANRRATLHLATLAHAR
ncbi:prenyltransferase/squalene oxidase repeat-containing protein [Kutzneria sp. CA-103260]|uniref:prenyltransferase/squalene oxidase repeat-containing protein n=1 Tax=Kutzneria sp. CA-103260 TaxID=2802641 RepID=UPI001BA89017|nr:prenyltransferase/squalene oxidase repeat-containing protein [Kutzneria sp. CA-103260]QUQ63512.1 Ent-copalyl diphosphate synthase [Kutzneria sp. CA-103260]